MLLFTTSAFAQDFEAIQNLVGTSQAAIEAEYGTPDEVGYNEGRGAVLWTYILRSDDEHQTLQGTRQFAFWNSIVAGTTTTTYTPEPDSLYRSSLEYMREDNRTIWQAGNSSIYSEHGRASRRGDNLWEIDQYTSAPYIAEGALPQVILTVSDLGFRSCTKLMRLEGKRVQEKFGLDDELMRRLKGEQKQ